MLSSFPKIRNKIIIAEYIGVVLFVFVSLLHFFSQRPLWLDEISILKNIQQLSYQELFGPLNYAQAFPRVYLVLIKFFAGHFGYHVLALRFFPLISMLLAYGIWRKIYREILGPTGQFLLALFSMTCSYYFSYYAGEFKPYAMDVFVVGIFVWVCLQQKKWEREKTSVRSRLWIILLPFALFFSYAAFLVFWIVGYNLLFSIEKEKEARVLWGSYIFFSSGCLALIYTFDLRHSWADQALMHYWDSYFICSQSIGCFAETVWEGLRRLATAWFGKEKIFMQAATFLIPFFGYALVKYGFRPWIKERGRIFSVESLFAVLFVELFVLGFLRKFPFTGERITLFFAPLVFYGLVRGIFDLKRIRPLYYLFLGSYVILLAFSYASSVRNYLSLYRIFLP